MSYPISIHKTEKSRLNETPLTNLAFGKIFTDHMLEADYYDGKWQNCSIIPYDLLPTSPSVYALHYGQSIFEGLKAVRNSEGNPMLFRAIDNWKRLNYSAHRMALPETPKDLFMDGLKELLKLDKNWIPTEEGSALYIRPLLYCAEDLIGIKPTEVFKLRIMMSPVSKYYDKPVKILVADKYVRACAGGTGDVKAAGNYGGTMLPMLEAKQKGFDQVLWMDAAEFRYLNEIGSMNIFVQIGDTFLTPELDGNILDGVTRRSVIALLKDEGYKVEERKIDIAEVAAAAAKGILNDAFGTGTAASIAPIDSFGYQGNILQVKPMSERKISTHIKQRLDAIKCGAEADKFGWIEAVN
jgi:branched-chain amino acid aminotransferase